MLHESSFWPLKQIANDDDAITLELKTRRFNGIFFVLHEWQVDAERRKWASPVWEEYGGCWQATACPMLGSRKSVSGGAGRIKEREQKMALCVCLLCLLYVCARTGSMWKIIAHVSMWFFEHRPQ